MDTSENGEIIPNWDLLPEHLLLEIFCYLSAQSVHDCSLMCRKWMRIAYDELLWKKLFYSDWNIDRSIPMSPGKKSWKDEYKRLSYHTPSVESEVLKQHNDQVLHVSFSHDGKMFSTCSKDGYVKVWNSTNPVTLKYKYNMKRLTWKYTQFSQFNETDTLLLVSGVHFGVMSTSGEIAVFSLVDDFQLQCRVLNKPYDVFGTWYNSSYLLSGNMHWIGPLQSYSDLWLNKAFQATDSEHESVVMRLYRFNNINASSIRAIMIANCVTDKEDKQSANKDGSSFNSNITTDTPTATGKDTNDKTSSSINTSAATASNSSSTSNNNNNNSSEQRTPVPVLSCTRAYNCPNCMKRRADKAQQEAATASSQQTKRSCKKVQCITLIENGRLQNRMLEVANEEDDSNEDSLNGTIEYSEDYRKAETTRYDGEDQDISDSVANNNPAENVPPVIKKNISNANSVCVLDCSEKTACSCSSNSSSSGGGGVSSSNSSGGVSSSNSSGGVSSNSSSGGVSSNSSSINSSSEHKPSVLRSLEFEEIVNSHKDSDFHHFHNGCVHYSNSSKPAGIWMPNRDANNCRNVAQATTEPLVAAAATTSSSSLKDVEGMIEKTNGSTSVPKFRDKYLIFTTGSKTYTPHQIGIKKVHSLEAVRYENIKETGEGVRLLPNVEDSQPGLPHKFDEVDHLIELDGHIIGMCLSPDHRYLYVNSRPWPENCYIENPLNPPPIAQEIDIHVIDLVHMKEVGTMHRSHKAYTPNDDCFFIFLDVCDEFVASGAEDKFGYLWDRHYGVCLHKFPHKDVVNSVAFHPKNPEMLVTVSDDHTVKIWRSRHLEWLCRQEKEKTVQIDATDEIPAETQCGLIAEQDYELQVEANHQ